MILIPRSLQQITLQDVNAMIDDLSQLLKQQKWKIETNLGDSVYVWLLGQSFVLPEASDAPSTFRLQEKILNV